MDRKQIEREARESIPKFGTPEYARWRERLIATCYDILAANEAFKSLRRRKYAPEFSRGGDEPACQSVMESPKP